MMTRKNAADKYFFLEFSCWTLNENLTVWPDLQSLISFHEWEIRTDSFWSTAGFFNQGSMEL